MSGIFELFSANGAASPSILLMLLIEPLLLVLGYLAILIISFKHYRQSENLGGLIILISSISSVIISFGIESYFDSIADESFAVLQALSKVFEAVMFLVAIYGFKLVCQQSESIANKPIKQD